MSTTALRWETIQDGYESLKAVTEFGTYKILVTAQQYLLYRPHDIVNYHTENNIIAAQHTLQNHYDRQRLHAAWKEYMSTHEPPPGDYSWHTH